jgi:hypothetical protein
VTAPTNALWAALVSTIVSAVVSLIAKRSENRHKVKIDYEYEQRRQANEVAALDRDADVRPAFMPMVAIGDVAARIEAGPSAAIVRREAASPALSAAEQSLAMEPPIGKASRGLSLDFQKCSPLGLLH